MENRFFLILLHSLLFLNLVVPSYCQDSTSMNSDVKNLDPRKYITIDEFDKNNGKRWVVWDGSKMDINDRRIVPQLTRTVDLNSELHIIFDSEKIRKLGFTGNISLQATIGERKIEVNPYSLIGQSQVNYGIKSKPVYDVARSLVLFSKISNVLHDFLKNISSNSNPSEYFFEERFGLNCAKQLESLFLNRKDKEGITLQQLFDENIMFENGESKELLLKHNNMILSEITVGSKPEEQEFVIYKPSFRIPGISISYISKAFFKVPSNLWANIRYFLQGGSSLDKKTLSEEIIAISDYLDKQESINSQEFLSSLKRQLSQFIIYYDYYTKDEDDTKRCVLTILGVDDLTFTNLFVRLKDFQNFITVNESKVTDVQLRKLSEEITFAIERTFYIHGDLQMFNVRIDTQNLYNSEILSPEDDKIVKKIESKINDFIANQFVTAIIDLRKAGIKEGETLSISLLWSKNHKSKSDNEYDPLIVASFKAKMLGWRLSTPPSIFLINRVGIDPDNLPNNYSPSRFKGSPGVSLMATFTGLKERRGSGGFLERISPSFGINVSYLDFDTTKDIEMGVGLVAGLFNNKVLFTWGHNLNLPQKSQYIGIGFSFAEIISEVVKPSK